MLEHGARHAAAEYEMRTWRDRTPDEVLDDRAPLQQRCSTTPAGTCRTQFLAVHRLNVVALILLTTGAAAAAHRHRGRSQAATDRTRQP